MVVITPDFIDRVIESGPLTEAQQRARSGTACPRNKAQWDKFSSWSLICEEILDTENEDWWCDDILAELTRRGFPFEQIDAMRRFAWKTVGWLNYDRMMWEWCHIDVKDIELALDWQLRDGIITQEQHDEARNFIENPALIQR